MSADLVGLVRVPVRLSVEPGAVIVRDLGRKAGGQRAVGVVTSAERLGPNVRLEIRWGSTPPAVMARAEVISGLCQGLTPMGSRSGTVRGFTLHPEVGEAAGRVVLPNP